MMPTGHAHVPSSTADAARGRDVALDRLLVTRIQNGDRDALGELYDRYSSLAMGVAVRVVRDHDVAEDVVHDAFVAAWRRIETFDAQRGSVRSWLLTIVRNRGIDRVRGRHPTIEIGEADDQALLRTEADPTLAAAIEQMGNDELRSAVEELPAEQREAIELAYFGGHTYRDIAALTGVPTGTANGRLRLALRKLRASLRGSEAEPAAARWSNMVASDE
jgi:RNA polymerase sigma-70 factor (ECF subfamily)